VSNAFRPATEERVEIARAVDAVAQRADYSLSVVTTVGSDGQLSGCLVGFVTQCSIEPPRFLVCLSKVNHTYFAAERAQSLVLHLLGESQVELAALFGEQTGDRVDKFEQYSWRPGLTGAPVLSECAAWMEGVILDRFDVGDHQALLLRPVTGDEGQCEGVLMYQSSISFRPGHPATG
jgi:flavin reductase (DIM6/NTAB) family NADH-FMN oxidoreductase RutF